mmetsp:Transcript_38654/g.90846  ORF Transcript_38654/g.90846 Transcript_38654/m.90846 type:complete len:89 (+) Transcript_38654:195-461(+)
MLLEAKQLELESLEVVEEVSLVEAAHSGLQPQAQVEVAAELALLAVAAAHFQLEAAAAHLQPEVAAAHLLPLLVLVRRPLASLPNPNA